MQLIRAIQVAYLHRNMSKQLQCFCNSLMIMVWQKKMMMEKLYWRIEERAIRNQCSFKMGNMDLRRNRNGNR